MPTPNPEVAAARIIEDAGGELVGRTRLQKVAYLLQLAGFSHDFNFTYKHYGPFSEDLAWGIDLATALGPVTEQRREAAWGGKYSIFTLDRSPAPTDPVRARFVQAAKGINAVELELAATAAFLFAEEHQTDPWGETAQRKPEKVHDGSLERAKAAYEALRALDVPTPLPALPSA